MTRMDKAAIMTIKDDVKVSAFVLEYNPEISNTLSLLEKIVTKSNAVEFSCFVSLKQRKEREESLKIELVKVGDSSEEVQTLLLATIPLSRETRRNKYKDGLVDSKETHKAGWDPYSIDDRIKINFRGVPVIGSGRYAIVTGVEVDDKFLVMDCQYFDVEVVSEDTTDV